MIKFACPGCSATFTVGDEKAGKSGKCPKCQSQFVIPAADTGATPAGSGAVAAPPPLPSDPPPRPSSAGSPPPADPNQPVEIQPCPKCQTRLSVLPSDIGVDIQCPSCETVFTAMRADAPPPPGGGSKGKGSSSLVKLGSGSEKDDEEDDRPSRRRGSRRDDDEDDRPSRRRSSRRDDDDDYDRPSRRRRGRSRGGWTEPHRGVMLIIFALLGWFVCVIFAIVGWVMAANDLKEIDAGRMDPEGRGLTLAAKVISMIACIVVIVGMVLYCGFVVLFAAVGAGR